MLKMADSRMVNLLVEKSAEYPLLPNEVFYFLVIFA